MYEVYGLKLADRDNAPVAVVLPRTDPGKLMGISYYMWCIKSADIVAVVDSGMSDEAVRRRKTCYNVASPQSQLSKVGVKPEDVKTVFITHLHDDHASAFDLYPNATFHIQRKEIEFFAAVNVKNSTLIHEVSNIAEVVRLNYAGRVKVVDGDEQIAVGLSLILVGGHTPGSQAVVVKTYQGTIVLCGDLVNIWRNIEENIPAGNAFDVIQCYSAFERVRKLASSPGLVIPGHDRLVMEKFPNIAEGVIRIGEAI